MTAENVVRTPAPGAAEAIVPASSRWLVLALVSLTQFMVSFDRTVVNVALPSIQHDLGIPSGDLAWVVNAYLLTLAGFLLLGGRAADVFGRKRIFLIGVVVFSLTSLLNGLADSFGVLVASRGMQGLGAALIGPATLAILMTTFPEGPERTKAIGIWVAVEASGGASGLVLGGLLTSLLSWPWIFIVNLPLGVAIVLVALRAVPESRVAGAPHRFDVGGAVLGTAGLVLLVAAIMDAHDAGWGSATTLGGGALALALLAWFVAHERRHPAPLVRFGIFRVRSFAVTNAATVTMDGALGASIFLFALYVQGVLGASPLEAGLAFLPVPVVLIATSMLPAQLVTRRLGIRRATALGTALCAVGVALLTRAGVGSDYVTDVLPALVVLSVGMGLAFTPHTLLATTNLDTADVGLASGIWHTAQHVGGALGLALIATVATVRTDRELAALGHAATPLEQTTALVGGYHLAFWLAAALLALTSIGVWLLLRRGHVPADESGVS